MPFTKEQQKQYHRKQLEQNPNYDHERYIHNLENRKKYAQTNKEHIKQLNQQFLAKHPNYRKLYYQNHKEHISILNATYQTTHRDQINKKALERYYKRKETKARR